MNGRDQRVRVRQPGAALLVGLGALGLGGACTGKGLIRRLRSDEA